MNGIGVDDGVSKDAIFQALANRQRRLALETLQQAERPVGIRELARNVAALESGKPLADVSPERVHEVEVALYHIHVPKLEDAGLISHDQQAGTVERTRWYDTLAPCLDSVVTA